MEKQREIELTRELGRLRKEYVLGDKSDSNLKIADRINEIREELGCKSKPRADRRPCVYKWR